jgi:hypothetical protein
MVSFRLWLLYTEGKSKLTAHVTVQFPFGKLKRKWPQNSKIFIINKIKSIIVYHLLVNKFVIGNNA